MKKERKAVRREGWMTAKKERISYAVGFNGAIGESLILQSFLSTYLLMSGIDIGISATVMLIVKVIDAVDDMLLGFLIDKIHPERNPKLRKLVGKGRYLPWLRLSFLVMPIAAILLYHIPEDAGIAPVLLINMAVPKLAQKYDKFKMMFILSAASVVTGAAVYFAGYQNITLHLVLYLINLIPASAAGILYNYLIPNCVEYGKYKSGIDGTGIAFAVGTFSYKVPGAVSSSLGMFVLGLYGWIPVQAESFAELEAMNFVQSEQALHGLWVISSGLPVIGVILGLICWSFYRLNDRDAALMAKINQGEQTREEAEPQMKRTY